MVLNFVRNVVHRMGTYLLAPEVERLTDVYLKRADIKVAREIEMFFFRSIFLTPSCTTSSDILKAQAVQLAPKLREIEELSDPANKVTELGITNCLLVDPGVRVELSGRDFKSICIRTTRVSNEIHLRKETHDGSVTSGWL